MGYFTFFVLFALIICYEAHAQNEDSVTVSLQPIIVTATRMPTDARLVNRSIDIIDDMLLKNLPLQTVEDVLQQTANVSVESRGVFGVQTDISMRGTLFSQNTILLNGLSVNDPQTAHYNFNLPVSIKMIDRIEVLRGPGSAQYGANAFGGVINVITKVPEETSVSLNAFGGENGLVGGEILAQYADASFHSINSISYKKSDGYHVDTDFLFQTIMSANEIDLSGGKLSFTGGYEKKEYGAFEFYTPGIPLPSHESLQTGFADVSFSTEGSLLTVTPRISYRRNTDQFILTLSAPSFYTGQTTTDVVQGEVTARTQLKEHIALTGGISLVWDDIISNYEGVHTRTDGALFASLVADLQPWIINVSLRFDAHSAYGKIICPSISTGYQFGTSGKIYATVGKAFRAPSYTELYINDGFNVGNPRLQPEIGWTYEIGGSYLLFSSIRFSSALFLNDQDNVIDYVEYNSTDTKYYAVNFYHVVIRGTEVSLRWDEMHFSGADVAIKHVSASYGYLDSQTSHDSVYAAKYSNNYPRHQISGSVVATLPFSLSGSIDVVYKVKVSGDSYTLLGTRLTKQIGRIVLNVSGTNLLNQAYEENVGVPLPGRWLWVGAELKVF
jgi:iron complex outermembrane receptor protein